MAEMFGPLQGVFSADEIGDIKFDAVELDGYLKQLEFKFDEGGTGNDNNRERGKGPGKGTT